MKSSHYFASNTFCYAKADNPEQAISRLEVTVFPHSGKDIPVTLIEVMEPIDKPYAISTFLPEGVPMIIIEQDYESNIELHTLCMLEDGIVYYGDAVS